jgi:hypothetical protein
MIQPLTHEITIFVDEVDDGHWVVSALEYELHGEDLVADAYPEGEPMDEEPIDSESFDTLHEALNHALGVASGVADEGKTSEILIEGVGWPAP